MILYGEGRRGKETTRTDALLILTPSSTQ